MLYHIRVLMQRTKFSFYWTYIGLILKCNCPWIWRKQTFSESQKLECLLFGTRQRLKISGTANFLVTLDRIPIKFSTVFKYLGAMLYNHLSFNEHINYMYTVTQNSISSGRLPEIKNNRKIRITSVESGRHRLKKSILYVFCF